LLPACLCCQFPMEPSSLPSATLFIADIPASLSEQEFFSVFQIQEGFKSARLRKDRNNHTVGLADFEDSDSASLTMETLQGYKWNPHVDKGITIHYSHNATNSQRTRTDFEKNTNRFRNERGFVQGSNARDRESPLHENGPRSTPPSLSVSFMPDLSPLQQNTPTQSQMPNMPNYTYPNMFPSLPTDASSTLYVEGLPSDATEREVAHIFRPFPGYQSLRILTKESKQNPSRLYNLCFVEFDNKYQATFALNHLQGYRLDKDDTKGLTMSYAKTERKPRLNKPLDGRLEGSVSRKSPSNTQRNE